MMGSLYEITQEFMEFQKQLEDMDLDDQTFSDTLDSAMWSIEIKAENIIKHMKTLEALADAKKLEAKRLSDSASSDLKKVEFFKNYLADNLKKANISKLQAGVFSLGFQKGREVVKIDEERIPHTITINGTVNQIAKYETKFDKVLVKKLLKEVNEIPGVSLVRNPDSLVVK